MRQELTVIWDWNGCLLDDCEHIYNQGPVRIFAHFNLPCPTLEAYRNEVEGDFMKSFYWKYGIPAEVTAQDLNAIMNAGYDKAGEASMHPDALAMLALFQHRQHRQVLVTGFNAERLKLSLAHHQVRHFFEEVHPETRDKTPVFQDVLARAGIEPSQAIGVTDTLNDVAMLEAAGIRAFICPRGFHGRAKIEAARDLHPQMQIIDGLVSLLSHLP